MPRDTGSAEEEAAAAILEAQDIRQQEAAIAEQALFEADLKRKQALAAAAAAAASAQSQSSVTPAVISSIGTSKLSFESLKPVAIAAAVTIGVGMVGYGIYTLVKQS